MRWYHLQHREEIEDRYWFSTCIGELRKQRGYNRGYNMMFKKIGVLYQNNSHNPGKYKLSIEIKKRLKEKDIQGIDNCYSLPKGGIVLQFENKSKRQCSETTKVSTHQPTNKEKSASS
ncbi:hypothetical protein DPMN_170336 [Dreissena polymorpha]|uniref:Uncharacterized protein n=1 Tax=Dreissena polymorpha TaxID=45954 RepID=A0A9D4DW55_DREPO|nr:hypothetical protein DPMN_170336 [Dreissena polymorpha]